MAILDDLREVDTSLSSVISTKLSVLGRTELTDFCDKHNVTVSAVLRKGIMLVMQEVEEEVMANES